MPVYRIGIDINRCFSPTVYGEVSPHIIRVYFWTKHVKCNPDKPLIIVVIKFLINFVIIQQNLETINKVYTAGIWICIVVQLFCFNGPNRPFDLSNINL